MTANLPGQWREQIAEWERLGAIPDDPATRRIAVVVMARVLAVHDEIIDVCNEVVESCPRCAERDDDDGEPP